MRLSLAYPPRFRVDDWLTRMSARRRARGGAAPWGRGMGMRSAVWLCWSGALALLCGGCMSGPLIDNPGRAAAPVGGCPNPVYLPHGPGAYGQVFEQVLDVVNDYFEIAYANRYDGRI